MNNRADTMHEKAVDGGYNLGYRAKRNEEKVGGPSDDVLVPYDEELQRSFEETIFELFADKNRSV